METFSLLQESLDQTIDRESLEDASMVAPSVARADCARLQRELFGILVSRLDRREALVFQAELKRRGFPTELVADASLPLLGESFQIQRIDVRGDALVLTDSMGREKERLVSDLVFLAAGFVKRIEFKSELHERLEIGTGYKGTNQLVSVRELKEETELQFRVDLFVRAEPNRLHATLRDETAIFHQGKPLRLKDRAGLEELMRALGNILPPERLSSWLRDPSVGRIYPNLPCYEEEIRWHFHRLKPRNA